ncbi:MAG: hypothetical protein S4CHLAM102_02290 [Chlamydiia bacterium]|nr:hypothetical protein [Chlamydiia bacterium]
MKRIITTLVSLYATTIIPAATTELELSTEQLPTSPLEAKATHNYFGVGFSALTVLPYAANIGMGTRVAIPGKPLGADVSLNYTSSFFSQYIFAKGMLPIYLNPQSPSNSWYVGPYATAGYNRSINEKVRLHKNDTGLLVISGFAIGKQKATNENLSFWQIGGNITRYLFRFAGENSNEVDPLPTFTFQYGVGF